MEESEAVHYSVPSYLAPNEGRSTLDTEHLTNHLHPWNASFFGRVSGMIVPLVCNAQIL